MHQKLLTELCTDLKEAFVMLSTDFAALKKHSTEQSDLLARSNAQLQETLSALGHVLERLTKLETELAARPTAADFAKMKEPVAANNELFRSLMTEFRAIRQILNRTKQ